MRGVRVEIMALIYATSDCKGASPGTQKSGMKLAGSCSNYKFVPSTTLNCYNYYCLAQTECPSNGKCIPKQKDPGNPQFDCSTTSPTSTSKANKLHYHLLPMILGTIFFTISQF